MRSALVISLLVLPFAADARAGSLWDDPAPAEMDEPAVRSRGPAAGSGPRGGLRDATAAEPAFRLELALGYASLVVDPDVGDGYGGGLILGYGQQGRLGVWAGVFFARNPFQGHLAEVGSSFLVGDISVGPSLQLTRPGGWISFALELGIGTYLVVPVFLESTWTLGISGGAVLSFRLTRWLRAGVRWRYNLFNLATISGPDLVDLKAFKELGVIDRMDLPVFLALTF